MNKKSHIIVTVTQEDIKRGKRLCADGCPIALATKRASGSEEAWVEGGTGVLIRVPGTIYERTWIGVDKETRDRIDRFMDMFDGGDDVEPTAFEIMLDEDWW